MAENKASGVGDPTERGKASFVPEIKPVKHIEYERRQSKYEHVPKLAMRAMILAPSGSGKTVLLQNMISDMYRGCFNIIYMFSPSIDIDHTWKPVKDYIAKEIKTT